MADDAGAMLVRSGLITAEALETARAAAATRGGTIGEHLVAADAITDEALAEFYRQRLLVPRVSPNTLAKLNGNVVAAIPGDMAVELRVIPVSFDQDKNLVVAMSDPSDRHAVDEIHFFTNVYVVRAVATQMQIAWCLAHYYGHVTELGKRLMQPRAARSSAAEEPKTTARAVAAAAAIAERSRPDSMPPPAPSMPILLTRANAPTAPPMRPLSALLTGTKAPAAANAAALEEPTITIEADEGERNTRPFSVPAPGRRKVPTPPELAARHGEVQVQTGRATTAQVTDEPRVVIDLGGAPPQAGEVSAAAGAPDHAIEREPSVEVRIDPIPIDPVDAASGAVSQPIEDPVSQPILLDRPRASSVPAISEPAVGEPGVGEPGVGEPAVVLQPKKPADAETPRTASALRRAERQTQVGIGDLRRTRMVRDTDVGGPPVMVGEAVTAPTAPMPTAAGSPADATAAVASPSGASAATAAAPFAPVDNEITTPGAPPPSVSLGAVPPSRSVATDAVDDGWTSATTLVNPPEPFEPTPTNPAAPRLRHRTA